VDLSDLVDIEIKDESSPDVSLKEEEYRSDSRVN
jgi:hypothetical protein